LSFDYTSRLQKGGALLEDMRRLVLAWSDDLMDGDPLQVAMRALGKATGARAKDTYVRSFRPRFIHGDPPNAWKLARMLEDAGASLEVLRPFYYWLTARAEKPLYEYVTNELCARGTSTLRIEVNDVIVWLRDRLEAEGRGWSPTILRKVARGMLAALRDFDILQGKTKKSLAPQHLSAEAFAIIAFSLHKIGASGKGLVHHPDWRLFLLGDHEVERCFLEAHQAGWLSFHAAGNIFRIDFPAETFQEYVYAILG